MTRPHARKRKSLRHRMLARLAWFFYGFLVSVEVPATASMFCTDLFVREANRYPRGIRGSIALLIQRGAVHWAYFDALNLACTPCCRSGEKLQEPVANTTSWDPSPKAPGRRDQEMENKSAAGNEKSENEIRAAASSAHALQD